MVINYLTVTINISATKGSIQILRERKVTFHDCGCKRDGKRKQLNKEKQEAYDSFSADKGNDEKLLHLLSQPSKEQVTLLVDTEHCPCAKCVLASQEDFASQSSGLEEEYDKFNKEHKTSYYCIFLPKFHPELNPIERVWSRVKWHIRRLADGTLSTLDKLIKRACYSNRFNSQILSSFLCVYARI